MPGQRPPSQPFSSRKGKTPAERAEECAATQRQLKEEAAERRKVAEAAAQGDGAPRRAWSSSTAG